MKNLLDITANIAKSGNLQKNYLLAALVKRKDGAIVVSQNGLTKDPELRAHAEAKVLKKSDANCTLYVARILRASGNWANSKPCPGCQVLIRSRHVKRVYYTIAPNEYGIWDVERDEWYTVKKNVDN